MPLHPPGNRRERLFIYGQPKTGKSTIYVDIAEWIFKTGGSNRVWVGDSDLAWEAMQPLDGHLNGIVQTRTLNKWDEYDGWLDEANKKAHPNREDWLVLDMVDKLYQRAQEAFYRKRFNKDLDEFFLETTDQATISGDFGKNWDVINKLYDGAVDRIHRFPGHVLVLAPALEVRLPVERRDGSRDSRFADDELTRDTFSGVGWKPNCRPLLPHIFHTVLFIQNSPSGVRLTSVGDRNRRLLTGESIGVVGKTDPQFVVKYLIGVAGWRP